MTDYLNLDIPELYLDVSNPRVMLSMDRTRVIINPIQDYSKNTILTFETFEDLILWMYDPETKEEKNWNPEYIDQLNK